MQKIMPFFAVQVFTVWVALMPTIVLALRDSKSCIGELGLKSVRPCPMLPLPHNLIPAPLPGAGWVFQYY